MKKSSFNPNEKQQRQIEELKDRQIEKALNPRSCNCMTKSSDWQHHKKWCAYRKDKESVVNTKENQRTNRIYPPIRG